MKRRLTVIAIVVGALSSGCVRRTVSFTSQPVGARVILNDREIGRTPATVEFTWYGDYDVIFRKDGFTTLKTHVQLDRPLYQYFPLDLFAELLWPGELHDHHEAPMAMLVEAPPVTGDALIERAMQLRDDALFQAGTDATRLRN